MSEEIQKFIEQVSSKYSKERYLTIPESKREKYRLDWMRKLPIAEKTMDDVEKRTGKISGKKVLDSGSGMGAFVVAFFKKGADAYGVEVEEELFDVSGKLLKLFNFNNNIKLYDGDILPFEDNFFDLIFSASVLEHTNDPALYLKELLRVSNEGGKFYLAFPNKLWPKETHTELWFLTYLPSFLRPKMVSMFGKGTLEEINLHFYSLFDLEKIIKNIECKGYKWIILNEEGNTKSGLKFLIKKILKSLGLSYKYFMPHVSVVMMKVKS